MTYKTVRLGVGLLAIAGVAALMIRLTSNHPSHAATTEQPKTVAVAKVTREDLARTVNLTAELRPYQDVNIHAKVTGYIKTINVDVGDQVKAGQVIATLDMAEQQADLAKAEANYQESKLDYERIQSITRKKPGLLAQDEVDKAKVAYEVAKANREHAKAFSNYAVITAPFDGIITKRFADLGALVQAGTSSNNQPLVHLADNTRLRLVFPVPESIVPQISVGKPVDIEVQTTDTALESKVARISGMIDNATRTMEVEVDLDNPGLRLTPGMYANVKMDLNKQANVLAVPVQAVAGKERPNVWVVNAEGNVEERAVTLGLQTPSKVEVQTGLAEGELVIFGNRNTAIGAKVTPKIMEAGKL